MFVCFFFGEKQKFLKKELKANLAREIHSISIERKKKICAESNEIELRYFGCCCRNSIRASDNLFWRNLLGTEEEIDSFFFRRFFDRLEFRLLL